jgi:hypothetical protein
MLQCRFTILPAKLRKLRDSIASKVGELVIVIEVWFWVDVSSAFRLYAEGLMQDSSQLVGYVIRIHARLNSSSSWHHVNWLRSKGELLRGLISKAAGFRLVVGVETWQVLVRVVG